MHCDDLSLNDYEYDNKRSGHGLLVILAGNAKNGGGPFWSKGWTGCSLGCGKATDRHVTLKRFVIHDAGTIRTGYCCVGHRYA